MITVEDLIELLQKESPTRIVLVSSDPEGNSYFYLSPSFMVGNYNEESREIGFERLTKVLKKKGYTKEDICAGTPALVLYPS